MKDDRIDNALNLLRSQQWTADSPDFNLEKRLMQEFHNQPSPSGFRPSRGLIIALLVLVGGGAAFAAGGGISKLRSWLFTIEIDGRPASMLVADGGTASMVITNDNGETSTVEVAKSSTKDGGDRTTVKVVKAGDGTHEESVAKIVRRVGGPGAEAESNYSVNDLVGHEPISSWTDEAGFYHEAYQLPAVEGEGSRFFLTTAPANDPNATATVKMLGNTPVSPIKGVTPTVEMADNGTITITQDDGQGRKMVMKFRSQSSTSNEPGLDPRNLDLNLNDGKLKVKVEEAQPNR